MMVIHDYIISTKGESYITIVDTHDVKLHDNWYDALAYLEFKQLCHKLEDTIYKEIQTFING